MQRTEQQNKAIHLLFRHLSDMLNDIGLDMKRVLKPEVDIPWTPRNVKEYLWRPVQLSLTGKESSKDLESKEIDQVYDVIHKHLAEKFGIEVRFPSIETMLSEVRRLELERKENK